MEECSKLDNLTSRGDGYYKVTFQVKECGLQVAIGSKLMQNQK